MDEIKGTKIITRKTDSGRNKKERRQITRKTDSGRNKRNENK